MAKWGEEKQMKKNRSLTSESFAALIVDALVDAKIVQEADTEKAIAIVTEEIKTARIVG